MSDAVEFPRTKTMKEKMPKHQIGRMVSRILMNIRKYAVDSAVRDALKVVTGRKQVQKVVKDLSDEAHSEDLNLMMEEIEAKMEKSKEIIMATVKGSGISIKQPDEGVNGLNLTKNNQKRIFIRSRL